MVRVVLDKNFLLKVMLNVLFLVIFDGKLFSVSKLYSEIVVDFYNGVYIRFRGFFELVW